MTDHPSLSEQRALIERLRTRTFIPDADFARTPESVHELVFNLRKQGDEAADLLEAAFAQPPASGVDRSREAVARVHAKHWSGSPWWWDAAFDDSTDETAARLREDDLEAADAILDALTNSGAPVPASAEFTAECEECHGEGEYEHPHMPLHTLQSECPEYAVVTCEECGGEGVVPVEEPGDYLRDRLLNIATICEAKGLLVEASGLRDTANIVSEQFKKWIVQ